MGKSVSGQGRIRTSVARKERQIYSLLPLTARPPVRTVAEPALPTKKYDNWAVTNDKARRHAINRQLSFLIWDRTPGAGEGT